MHQFWVVRGPGEELIIGMDFIHHHGLQYHSTCLHFSWKDKSVQNLEGLPDRPKLLSLPEPRGTDPSTPGLLARVPSHLPQVSSPAPYINQDLLGPLYPADLLLSHQFLCTNDLTADRGPEVPPKPTSTRGARPTSPKLPTARTPTGQSLVSPLVLPTGREPPNLICNPVI